MGSCLDKARHLLHPGVGQGERECDRRLAQAVKVDELIDAMCLSDVARTEDYPGIPRLVYQGRSEAPCMEVASALA